MIRVTIATILVFIAMAAIALGEHPLKPLIASVVALGLVGWYLADRFEPRK